MALASETKEKKPLHCSFCAKSQHEVRKLIAGPAVFICDECAQLCVRIVAEGYEAAMTGHEPSKDYLHAPDKWPTERHIALLEARAQLAERASAALQNTIDILRKREVSWAVIGAALGVSRQAAWERFG